MRNGRGVVNGPRAWGVLWAVYFGVVGASRARGTVWGELTAATISAAPGGLPPGTTAASTSSAPAGSAVEDPRWVSIEERLARLAWSIRSSDASASRLERRRVWAPSAMARRPRRRPGRRARRGQAGVVGREGVLGRALYP